MSGTDGSEHEVGGDGPGARWALAGPLGSRLRFDPAGGGFAGWCDPAGRDWVAFRAEPLEAFPASAAAGYRGLGNLVYGGPWSGAGHPGFRRCRSVREEPGRLAVETHDGAWAWDWQLESECLRLSMRRTPAAERLGGRGGASGGESTEPAWWFLYEGPMAGRFAPLADHWGDANGIGSAERPGIADQPFAPRRWIWLGAEGHPWALWLGLRVPAGAPVPLSTLWWMGAQDEGRWSGSKDGMVVFGFGRGPGTRPLLRGPGWEVVATWLRGGSPEAWQGAAVDAARRWLEG
jgi:hypothetical protein